jgi:hypothetical protein
LPEIRGARDDVTQPPSTADPAPATAGLDQRDEPLDHFVEQRRLFQIEHVADFGKKVEPAAGRCFFRNRLGSMQLSSSSPQMISAGVGTLRIASVMV